jgi:hypothetical protein
MTRALRTLLGVLLLVALSACSTTKQAPVRPSGFLGDYSEMTRGTTSNDPELTYEAPNVAWKTYDKVLLDPVTIWRSQGATLEVSQEDGQTIVNNFYTLLHHSLSQQYQMVDVPGPNTLRIAVAFTQLGHARPALNVIASIVPQLRGVGLLQTYVADKPRFTGEGAIEVRVLDADDGRYLFAEATRRVGKRQLTGSWQKWRDVNEAMAYWAQQLTWELCKNRAGNDCVPPQAGKGF